LSLSALGNIRTESLRAFSSTDMLKIVAKMQLSARLFAAQLVRSLHRDY
jgi:hypothetical protein